MTEPNLPRAWLDAYRKSSTPSAERSECPDTDQLAMLAVDPPSVPSAVLDHVAQCSACSEELKRVCDDGTLRTLTAALQADSASANSLSNEARHSGRRRSVLGGLALAASLVVAVAVTWIVLPPQEIPILRGGSPVEGLVPQSGAVLDRPPAEFRWPADGAAEALVLMNAEAEVLWTAPAVRDGVLELPAAVRDGLEPGRYYWQVRGLERDALLGPFEFHLEPAR